MNTALIGIFGIVLGIGAPIMTYAADASLTQTILKLTGSLSGFIAVLTGLALAAFLIGMVSFVRKTGEDKDISAGRRGMLWGVVGLFVIMSLWGIITILFELFGVDENKSKCASPQVNGMTVTSECGQ